MAQLVAISDTHTKHRELTIPRCDVLVHAGDLSFIGERSVLEDYAKWVSELKELGTIKESVVIAGNHDWAFMDARLGLSKRYHFQLPESAAAARAIIERSSIYLEQSEATVAGLRFWGSPWTPAFCDWAFNAHRDFGEPLLSELWSWIPEGLDVLVTHGPPHGVLDYVGRDGGLHVGCHDLKDKLGALAKPPALHLFGHIHCGNGAYSGERTLYLNASSCNEAYACAHEPWLVELTDGKAHLLMEMQSGQGESG